MKITLFIATLQGGGAERTIITLANGFADRKHDVDLVLVKAEGSYLDQGLLSPHVRIVNLNACQTRYALWPWMKYLYKSQPDVILSFLTDINLIAIAGKYLTFSPAKLIVSERSFISIITKYFRPPSIAYRLALFFLYRLADNITCVSYAAATDLEKFAKLRKGAVRVIYNPLDIDTIKTKSQEPIPHPWLEAGQSPVILAVGRLEPVKNYELLFNAFAQVNKKLDCRLLLVGEGPLQQKLKALVETLNISENVVMVGFSANPYAYMAHAKVFVLSSNYEGFPNVLTEALACGCPVVSTNCPSGPAEILDDGKYGLLVPVNNLEALAKAIEETIIGKTASTKDQRIARASSFAKDFAIADYLELFSEC